MSRSELLRKSREQLDELFKRAPPGNMPDGEGTGTVLILPGTGFAKIFAWLTRCLLWQGKIFNARALTLRNRITVFSLPAIKANIYQAPSWLDGKDSIVLDYSKTSLLAGKIRDEIREIEPGLYLGKVWWGRKSLTDFVVSFQYEPVSTLWRRVLWAVSLAVLILAAWLTIRLTTDRPVTYVSMADHFKYGSTGGERSAGIPYSIWKLLPELFPEKLPGNGYASLGFIYETDKDGKTKDLPIGVSKRNVMGIDRVFLNCAVCHVGSVRDTPVSAPRIILGMPSNTVDLEGFQRFLTACAKDEKFTPDRIVPEIKKRGGEDWLNRLALRLVGVTLMRNQLLMLSQRFSFLDREPECGPGRFDTFNPPKILLNFRMDNLPIEEWIGLCDFPSIWNQRKREGMWLHWDGNNNSVRERNRSAAFGTGATPPTLDRASITRTEDWLLDAKPPAYPYPIDQALAAKGELLYAQTCASCHGKNGSDFTGEYVGRVTPIEKIKTDRHRLDSYSEVLCVNQNLLYAGYGDERFSHFRKTFGYANSPLDGVWLRGPYLHNGSVPTLRDLLEPVTHRPKEFYRGYDVYDPKRVGFASDLPQEGARKFFRYDTTLPGNGNFGHEGPEYGTELSPEQKDAIVEFLKTF